jgi:hypothetical protein
VLTLILRNVQLYEEIVGNLAPAGDYEIEEDEVLEVDEPSAGGDNGGEVGREDEEVYEDVNEEVGNAEDDPGMAHNILWAGATVLVIVSSLALFVIGRNY